MFKLENQIHSMTNMLHVLGRNCVSSNPVITLSGDMRSGEDWLLDLEDGYLDAEFTRELNMKANRKSRQAMRAYQ
jgi:hypothetical protein